jgi:hypothetical protein
VNFITPVTVCADLRAEHLADADALTAGDLADRQRGDRGAELVFAADNVAGAELIQAGAVDISRVTCMSTGRVNVEAAVPIPATRACLFDEVRLRKSVSVAWKKFGVLNVVLNVVVLERRRAKAC